MIRGRTVIGTLRLHGADDGRARGALERVGLRPGGMPADAVLVVRRLADPLPGRLGRPSATSAWETAAVRALGAARARAVRPAAGPVPARADAVLFDDWAQLLAALAGDWLSGELVQRWWWRELTRSAPARDAVVRTWRSAARDAPAALAQLALGRLAMPFAQRLAAGEAAVLAAEIARAWGGPAHVVTALGRPNPDATGGVTPARCPWTALVPEAEAGPPMSPEGRTLLGVGLMLARAPAIAVSTRFWAQVAAPSTASPPTRLRAAHPWPALHLQAGHALDMRPRAGHPPTGKPADGEPACPVRTSRTGPYPWEPARAAEAVASPYVAHTGLADLPTRPGTAARPELAHLAADQPEVPTVSLASDLPVGARAGVSGVHDETPMPGAVPEPTTTPGPPVVVQGAAPVQIDLGGLLFLLNLAIEEGLYSDFAHPVSVGLPISPWDLLGLVGPFLLGDADQDDPVWALLGALAGREGNNPRSPRACRRWAARLASRWQDTLAQRLGSPPDEAGPLLLRLPAAVRATPTRLSATYDLAALPIAVRIAGLDRDPGWIPACGRIIQFEFE